MQVVAAPKRKPKEKENADKDKAEEVAPQTWEEKAKDAMGELLSDAAKARTESIKLSNVPYAKELSGQLLQHAAKLEGFYKEIEKNVSEQASEKEFKSLMKKVIEATAFTAKAQAWGDGCQSCSAMGASNYVWGEESQESANKDIKKRNTDIEISIY